LIPTPCKPVNGQTCDAVDPARGEVHEGMLIPWAGRSWPPSGGYVLIAVNDDAHTIVADMVEQFEVLSVGGFLNDLDCSVG
jgi:hypothetical protein